MNKDKLKGKIKENKFNYNILAKKLNIGYSTIKAKVNGKSAFNQPEMVLIRKHLRLSDAEIIDIFF
nr:MAG TPA: Regulatory protein [Caudoviricetes sp.]